MSKKKLKKLIEREHRRTMSRGKLDDEAELAMVAMVMSMQGGMSTSDTFQFFLVGLCFVVFLNSYL